MDKTYHHNNVSDSDTTLNAILALIAEGVWDWESRTGNVTRSPGWYRMLDYDIGVFEPTIFTWESIIHPDDYSRVMKHFELYTSGQSDTYQIEYRCKKADGTYLWITDRGKILSYNQDGSVSRMIGAHQNIHNEKTAQSELIKQNQLLMEGNTSLEQKLKVKAQELEEKNKSLESKVNEIEIIANTDSLTLIPNRKKFEEALTKEIARANRYMHPLSVALFDIDFFKQINDRYGHKVGDKLLRNISALVANNIRSIDFFARWGGDEFVLIFPDLTPESANGVCEKLRKLITEHETEKISGITSSFGVTGYIEGDTNETIFQRVDKLMYQSKEKGRNRVEN